VNPHQWKRKQANVEPYVWWECERCKATSVYNPHFKENGPIKPWHGMERTLEDCDEQLCLEVQEK
jgi:hypothetical protein